MIRPQPTAVAIMALAFTAACTVDIEPVEGVQIRCDSKQECPDDHECVGGRCAPLNGNRAPSVSIDPIAPSRGIVAIPLNVIDAESDEVTLTVEVGRDGVFDRIAIADNVVGSSPDGLHATLFWDAAAYFIGDGLVPDLVLRVTPRDQFRPGSSALSGSFSFGNNAPRISNLLVTTDAGQVRGAVTVSVTVVDDSEPVSLASAALRYSDGSTVDLDPADFAGAAVGLPSDPAGATTTLEWNSAAAAPLQASDVVLTLTLEDGLGDSSGEPTPSNLFAVDNAPRVVQSGGPPSGASRWLNQVETEFTVDDAAGEVIDLYFEFRIGAGNWREARAGGSDPFVDLGSGLGGTFVWDAVGEAASTGLGVSARDQDGDGIEDDATVDYTPVIELRATPTNALGLAGEPVVLPPFALGDDPPAVTVAALVGEQRGDVPIAFSVADVAADPVDVELEFCLDGEGCALDAAPASGGWRLMAIAHGSRLGVASGAAPGVEHVVTWSSMTPLDLVGLEPSPTEGVGATGQDDVHLRLRGSSAAAGDAGGAQRVFGEWSQPSSEFGEELPISSLTNQSPPRVQDVSLRRLGIAGGVTPVAIDYTLLDAEADPADVLCEFTQDGGQTYSRCTELAVPESEGRYDLATGFPTVDGGGGVRHTFVWDPTGQGMATSGTSLRFTSTDGHGAPSTTLVDLRKAAGPELADRVFGGVWDYETGYGPVQPSGGACLPDPFFPGGGCNVCGAPPAERATLADLEVADLDGDGAFEAVATFNFVSPVVGARELHVYRGVAYDGIVERAFSSSYPYEGDNLTLDHAPGPLALADFDGDGDVDAVVGATDTGAISLFLNDGGELDPATPQSDEATDAIVVALAAADFNDDGRADLAIAELVPGGGGPDTGLVEVALGQASGAPPVPTYSYPLPAPPLDIAAADLDADGDADLAVLASDAVELLLGDASGEHQLSPPLAPAGGLTGFAARDLDGDGAAEIVVVRAGGAAVLVNDGDAGFSESALTQSIQPTEDLGLSRVVLDDFSGDGAPDVFAFDTVYDGAPTEILWRNDGTGGLLAPEQLVEFSRMDAYTHWLAAFAVPGGHDAAPDIIYGVMRYPKEDPTCPNVEGAYGLVRRMSGAYTGSFVTGLSDGYQEPGGWLPRVVEGDHHGTPLANPRRSIALDVDDDGRLDVVTVCGANSPSGLTIARGNGSSGLITPSFRPGGQRSLTDYAQAIASGDFNGDGRLDVVVAFGRRDAPGSSRVRVLIANGQSGFVDGALLSSPGLDRPTSLVVADFDRDGILDIAAGSTRPIVSVWLGNDVDGVADGTFGAATEVATGVHNPTSRLCDGDAVVPRGLGACDLDSDGNLDLVVSNNTYTPSGAPCAVGTPGPGTLSLRYGNGDGTFGAGQDVSWSDGESFIVADLGCADLDRDGLMDVVAVGDAFNGSISYPRLNFFYGQGSGGLGNGDLGDQLPMDLGSTMYFPNRVAIGDLDGDGVLDLAVSSTMSGSAILTGTGIRWSPLDETRMLPAGTGTLQSVLMMDVDDDHLLDVVLTTTNRYAGGPFDEAIVPFFSTAYHREPWHRGVTPFSAGGGSAYSDDLRTEGVDRFGGKRASHGLSQLRATHGPSGESDFYAALRRAVPEVGQGMVPLTDAWLVTGDVRLTRVPDPPGMPDTEGRLRVESRWGPRNAPGSSRDFDRTSFDVESSPSFAEQRGFVVELPIPDSADDGFVDSGAVQVYQAVVDWRRAGETNGDPMEAAGYAGANRYLPRLPTASGGWRDVVIREVTWRPVELDDTGFEDGTETGPRFVVTRDARGRRVRIFTDRLGYFQAFVAYP